MSSLEPVDVVWSVVDVEDVSTVSVSRAAVEGASLSVTVASVFETVRSCRLRERQGDVDVVCTRSHESEPTGFGSHVADAIIARALDTVGVSAGLVDREPVPAAVALGRVGLAGEQNNPC